MVHKRSTALERSVKIFTGWLKPVLQRANRERIRQACASSKVHPVSLKLATFQSQALISTN